MFASHYHLDNLCVLVDNNGLQIDGNVADVMSPYPIDEKFKAFGFHVINIDGHDFDQIEAAYQEARTVKGSRPPSSPRLSRARAFPSWKIRLPGTALHQTTSSMRSR